MKLKKATLASTEAETKTEAVPAAPLTKKALKAPVPAEKPAKGAPSAAKPEKGQKNAKKEVSCAAETPACKGKCDKKAGKGKKEGCSSDGRRTGVKAQLLQLLAESPKTIDELFDAGIAKNRANLGWYVRDFKIRNLVTVQKNGSIKLSPEGKSYLKGK